MSIVVLDTDVSSHILRGRVTPRLRARLAGASWCITLVTLGELTRWTIARSWGPSRLADLAEWRRRVGILPMDEAVATTWGELQARGAQRGRPRPVNDTWIAACCLVNGLPLATLNVKDFADFAQYEGLQLLDVS